MRAASALLLALGLARAAALSPFVKGRKQQASAWSGFYRADGSLDDFRQKISSGITKLLDAKNYDRAQPVIVMATDFAYDPWLVKWSKHMASVGLNQQVIIALDQQVVDVAVKNELPAITETGDLVRDAAKKGAVPPPKGFTALKFLVPDLLMEHGFGKIISADADVHFFDNPFEQPSVLADAYALAGMGSTPWGRRNNELDTGFLMFSGNESQGLLRKYVSNWWEDHGLDGAIRQDMATFNKLVKTAQLPVLMLPDEAFAVCPLRMRPASVLVHLGAINMRELAFIYRGKNWPMSAEDFSGLAVDGGSQGHCKRP